MHTLRDGTVATLAARKTERNRLSCWVFTVLGTLALNGNPNASLGLNGKKIVYVYSTEARRRVKWSQSLAVLFLPQLHFSSSQLGAAAQKCSVLHLLYPECSRTKSNTASLWPPEFDIRGSLRLSLGKAIMAGRMLVSRTDDLERYGNINRRSSAHQSLSRKRSDVHFQKLSV